MQEHKVQLQSQLQDLTKQLKTLQAQHSELSSKHNMLEQSLVSQGPISVADISDQPQVEYATHHMHSTQHLAHPYHSVPACLKLRALQ